MRRRRWLARVLVVMAVLVAPLALYAQPSFALSGCIACEDEDPNTWKVWTGPYDYYLCSDPSDAKTVGWAYNPSYTNLYVELRYSSKCRTVWARGTGSGFDFGVDRLSPAKTAYCCAATGGGGGSWSGSTIRWTNMLNDGGVVSRAWFHDGHTGQFFYSNWY
jgi:hypothetical protein